MGIEATVILAVIGLTIACIIEGVCFTVSKYGYSYLLMYLSHTKESVDAPEVRKIRAGFYCIQYTHFTLSVEEKFLCWNIHSDLIGVESRRIYKFCYPEVKELLENNLSA